ncbi:unnamed protein product [Rodentolepis nana]|uniref:Chromo domain-containing protein n=1 Tax=Rodentolepis nana TaxID=102285 RepID=A0A0R3TVN8_RODNA|nr:unnamed protein product [Rodentolepis nana]
MAPVVGVIDGANTKLSAFKRPLFKADGRRSLIGSLGVRSGRISSTINASTQTIDYLATPPDSKQNRVEASSSSKNQLTNSRPLHDEIDLTSPVTIVSTPFISHNEEGIGENFSKFRGIISHSNESEDMPEGGLTGGVDTNAIPINDSKAPSGFIKGENDNLLHAGAVDFNPALPYCKHQRREDGKKPGEMDVHFFGSEHSNIPGVDLDKSLSSHLPTGSQTPPSHEREVNEATMAIITKDESVLGQSHSHANEVAVNPASRGLFSSSEENEAMETNELALTGGVETPTSSSKKPKKVLERVLREMRDSEGNTFFRVKWQGTRTPEKLSEVEMTEYALGAFKYYRKRISELKRLLGRNKE